MTTVQVAVKYLSFALSLPMCVCACVYIYIYIYIEREREVKRSLDRPLVFQEVEAPRFLDSRHVTVPYAPAAFTPPGNIPGTHCC